MEVDFAFLCDLADASGDKLHAMGIGIDVLGMSKTPGVHPGIFVVVQIRFERSEIGDKKVALTVMGPDGEDIARGEVQISVDRAPKGTERPTARLVVPLKPIPLPKFGPYSVDILVNGNHLKSIGFEVSKPPATG